MEKAHKGDTARFGATTKAHDFLSGYGFQLFNMLWITSKGRRIMTLPGFTAEGSLPKVTANYHVPNPPPAGTSSQEVVPQYYCPLDENGNRCCWDQYWGWRCGL